MRVRKLSPSGDYTFGRSAADFHVNTPDAPATLVSERMHLWLGDWYLDITDGVPYREQILGKNTEGTRDPVIRARMASTLGIVEILDYSSVLNRDTRGFSVAATLKTAYGAADVSTNFGGAK